MGDPTGLLQTSVIGVMLLLMVLGWVWPKPSVDQLKADKEKAEAQRDALLLVMQEKVIPALHDASASQTRSAEVITEKLLPILERVSFQLEQAK